MLTAAAHVDLGVHNIWAKAITEAHGRILERVGCHHVVSPEADMGRRVAHLVTGSLLEYRALDEDFAIVETTVPTGLDGLRLGETQLRAKSTDDGVHEEAGRLLHVRHCRHGARRRRPHRRGRTPRANVQRFAAAH